MGDFQKAYKELMRVEGFYSMDPSDPGGETIYGISRRNWPKWVGWEIVDLYRKKPNFPEVLKNVQGFAKRAEDFYKANFWDKLSLDQIPEGGINTSIKLELFDTAVNQGLSAAGEIFQRGLNLHNRDEQDYQDILVDGKVGSNTLGAYRSCRNKEELFVTCNVLQGAGYIAICEKNKKMEKYYNGWIARRVRLDVPKET